MAKSEKAPKVERPMAPHSGKLPDAPANCEWDTTDIGPWKFAILVAKNPDGIATLARSGEKAVGLFNRAWRILVPAQIGARDIEKSKMDKAWAEQVQKQILAFDPSQVRTRAPRGPTKVTATKAEVEAMGGAERMQKFLEARGLKLEIQA
jgi:hypothetical protein